VNRASRFCDGAKGGEVLISPDIHKRVWNLVRSEKTKFQDKHNVLHDAYRVVALQKASDRPA
jgi:hypothetical protein